MKNIRFWAYTSAFLSLVISLAIVGYWICSVNELKVVNLNTFVGVTVALLGMIVTLAVAWQIYNAIEMRNKIEELKTLEAKFKEQNESIKRLRHLTGWHINYLYALGAEDSGETVHAVRFIMAAIRELLKAPSQSDIDQLFIGMKRMVNKISLNTEYNSNRYNDILRINEQIQAVDNYCLIKSRYEPLYGEFISKLKIKSDF